MPEFELVSGDGQERRRRGGDGLRWLSAAQNALVKAAIRSLVAPGRALDNLLRSVDINTRAPRKKRTLRSVDAQWNAYVHEQIAVGARRPAVSHRLWPFLIGRAGPGCGTVTGGPRDFARELGLNNGHVAEALAELVAMNALIKRVAWPDGPDYVVNCHVLPEAGGTQYHLDQLDQGKPRPLACRR